MAIPKFLEDLNIIAKLGDNPGADNGLTTSAFRAKFDEAALLIQTYINDVIVPAIGVQSNPEDGLRMKGNIEMDGNRITGLATPVYDDQAVPKTYVDQSVSDAKLYTDNSIKSAKQYVDTKISEKMASYAITLKRSNWANNLQTVSVPNVTANASLTNVIVSPVETDDDYETYQESGIRAVAQLDGKVQFKCSDVPASDIYVNVMVVT